MPKVTINKRSHSKSVHFAKPTPVPLLTRILEVQSRAPQEVDPTQDLTDCMSQLRLGSHIITNTPTPSNIPVPTLYQPPPPIPEGLHFNKTKILLRKKEVSPMAIAVHLRLEALFKKLSKDDELETPRISEDVKDKLWGWGLDFESIYKDWDEICRIMTNKEWRSLVVNMRKVGRVSFKNLDKNLPAICNQLVALDIKFL
jgi:hypothetical protein